MPYRGSELIFKTIRRNGNMTNITVDSEEFLRRETFGNHNRKYRSRVYMEFL